jgi:hydrogenase small subunit
MGCKGPTTYNACSVTKWNQGLGYPIQAGHGCIGCSEEAFWDKGPFYKRLPNFPGFGIESTADTVGTAATVATVGGVALHAIGSAIRKRRVVHENMEESVNLPHEPGDTVRADKTTGTNGGDAS